MTKLNQDDLGLIHGYLDNLSYYDRDDARFRDTKKLIIDIVKKL